jgi:outer membrane immunogenic protein
MASQPQDAVAQSYNWTGLYFGAHLGGAWSDATATDVLPPLGGYFTPTGNSFSFEMSGVAGGGQLGYQHQFGNWVLGAEVAGTWADLRETQTSPYFPASDTVSLRINPILTATARLGYAWDRWLIYVKGGYAGADVELNAHDRVADVGLRQNDHWVSGYTVGAGLEYALFEGVRIGIDYSYIDLQSETLVASNTLGGDERFATEGEIHSVTARLNFQLSRAAPAYEPLK